MAAKALIEIDIQIAVLREQTADGERSDWTEYRLQELLEKRQELILQMLAERSGEHLFARS